MPNFDQTGPNGNGPLTGRGAGDCQGPRQGGFLRGIGRGISRGFGRGFGFRRWCPLRNSNQQPINDKAAIDQEIQATKEYLQSLEEEKKNISQE